MDIVLVVLNLSHNLILTVNRHLWLGLNRHGLLIRPWLKTLVFPTENRKLFREKQDVEILNTSHCKTLSLKQLIRKPPKKFCKQKISDSLEERITLTNDYILPMRRSMCFLFMTWSEVSHEVLLKRKNITKLVVIKTCRPYLFQMTCSAERLELSRTTALCNASGFCCQPTNPSYTG